MRYEYFIGLRYLRAKRRQTFVSVITAISVAGVTVGVAALIIVLSGMVGVQEYMRDKILGFNAHIIVTRFSGITDPGEIVAKVDKVPHVTGASPYIQDQAMLRGRSRSTGVLLRGIDTRTVRDVMTIGDSIISGSLAELDPEPESGDTGSSGLPAIAIGKDLAGELGVFHGDEISVIIPEGVVTPLGMRPRVKRFRVGCIFKFGFYEVDSSVAMVNIDAARKIFNRADTVDAIEIRTDNLFTVEKTEKQVREALGNTYRTTTWYIQQEQLFAALKTEQRLSALVLSLIMLVASFNIISMLLMLVMEKYRDIAILKSMGATDGGIMRVFMVQGTVIGVIGALVGVIIGVAVCWIQMRYQLLAFNPEIYQFSVVPMKLTVENILGVAFGAMLLAFLTTLYPSWQAARMKPAESLRYE